MKLPPPPCAVLLVTIVTGAYKPTYNWGASHCSQKKDSCEWVKWIEIYRIAKETIFLVWWTEILKSLECEKRTHYLQEWMYSQEWGLEQHFLDRNHVCHTETLHITVQCHPSCWPLDNALKEKHQSIVVFFQVRLPQVHQNRGEISLQCTRMSVVFPTFQHNTRWLAPR